MAQGPQDARADTSRLEFLYETAQRVGSLLDEQKISEFVVKEASELLGCERASIMLLDPATETLRIRASVGLPQEVIASTAVKPGERISGKVFLTGQDVVVGEGDPIPAGSIGSRELKGTLGFLSVSLTTPAEEGHEPQIVGVINLTRKKEGESFTPTDVKLIRTLAAHTAAHIVNCRLVQSERERQRMETELNLAAKIQLGLLPATPLTAGPLQVAGVCRPARRVGGDFFDYWVTEDHVCLLVADVMGHDIGAALLASALRSVMRTEARHRASVMDHVRQASEVIFEDLQRTGMNLTLCYLEVHAGTKLLTYCRCGHPFPLLLRGDKATWLSAGGPALGLYEAVEFEAESLPLLKGDRLAIYTDGITDAGVEADRPFGQERLVAALKNAGALQPGGVAEHVIAEVQHHLGSTEPADDLTVLIAELTA